MQTFPEIAKIISLTIDEEASIRDWLVEQLVAQEHAKLEQGGHTKNQIPLRRVFVDLPVCDHPVAYGEHENRANFLQHLLESPAISVASKSGILRFGRNLMHATRSINRVGPEKKDGNTIFSANLLIGGPGQGKSTLGQYASQIYRSAILLPYSKDLTYLQRNLVNSFNSESSKPGVKLWPKQIFLPIQISLPELSTWLARDTTSSIGNAQHITRFICDLPSAKSAKLTVETLYKVFKNIPLFLNFDGFDEVGAAEDRKRIVSVIREFILGLSIHKCSVQILATTRPQGYTGELEHIGVPLTQHYLMPLSKEEAIEYATKLLAAKIGGADDRQKMLSRLKEAADDAATARLLTTPLQVTILAALVQQIGRAPRERWNLFYRYFSYTYDREIERETYASSLLSTFRPQIERIHARVGLMLQVEAERIGGASARMKKDKLIEVIESVLSEDEFSDEERTRLTHEIAIAAENRLVFLVEPEPGAFGFEIRSLQEFMAAWAISSGRDIDVEARIKLLAGATIFRNVMLFVASRFFSESSSLRDVISNQICEDLDEHADAVMTITRAGAILALEILEEGAVLSQPKRARALMERAVVLLELPATSTHKRLANAVSSDTATTLLNAIELEIRKAEGSRHPIAAWVCLCELLNGDDKTAEEIAERYWSDSFPINLLIADLRSCGIRLNDWLLQKVELRADEIRPTSLQEFRVGKSNANADSSWAKWFSCIPLEILHRERKSLNCFYLTTQRARIPKLPKYSIPLPWLHHVRMIEFELAPTLIRYAIALEAIADRTEEDWRDGCWYTSWPIKAAISAATDKTQLREFSRLAREGVLGSIDQWRRAQEAWPPVLSTFNFSELSSMVPWSTETILQSPPLAAVAPWNLMTFADRIEANIFEDIVKFFGSTTAVSLKQWSVVAGLYAVRNSANFDSKKLASIRKLLQFDREALGLIIPKPKSMKVLDWFSLLENYSYNGGGWVTGPHEFFDSIKFRKSWPANFFEMAAHSIEKHSADFIGTEAEEAFENMRKLLAAAPFRDVQEYLYIGILKIYVGTLEESEDDKIVETCLELSVGHPALLQLLIDALRTRFIGEYRLMRILMSIFPHVAHNYNLRREVIELLKSCLNARKTGLESVSVWNKMGFGGPAPIMLDENFGIVGLAQEPVSIACVELKNIGRFPALEMAFADANAGAGQWVIILGENGSGKSTILRAIVVALRNVKDAAIWPMRTFAREWVRVGCTEDAEIKITLNSGSVNCTSIRLSNSLIFNQTPEQHVVRQIPIFAYGCRRGSAMGGSSREVEFSDGLEIATLMDDGAVLIHAETWLKDMEADAHKGGPASEVYPSIVSALQKLLDVPRIFVENRKVYVAEKTGLIVAFADLSDGYLTNAGWFIDLVARWLDFASKAKIAVSDDFFGEMTGIVLIDEIDLHLHPQWQMDIIDRTRSIFPKLSFIVTTHNPLTLVGARSEEIWVLDADDSAARPRQGLGTPMLLTGGQLFARFFGVRDIYPADLGRSLQRYNFLSGIDDLFGDEIEELEGLRKTLEKAGISLVELDHSVSNVPGIVER